MLHQALCEGGDAFRQTFQSETSFKDFHSHLVSAAESLLATRKSVYDKDGSTIMSPLGAIVKGVPTFNPEDTKTFISSVNSNKEKLLESCDMASEIIASVEKDVSTLGCTENEVCSVLRDALYRLSVFVFSYHTAYYMHIY